MYAQTPPPPPLGYAPHSPGSAYAAPPAGYYYPYAHAPAHAPVHAHSQQPHAGPSSMPAYAPTSPSPSYPSPAAPSNHYAPPQPYPSYQYAPPPARHAAAPPPVPPVVGTGIAPIPAPTQRVEYQAPVFKTFQERKREREAALRAAAAASAPSTPPAPPPAPRPAHAPPPSQMRSVSPSPSPAPGPVQVHRSPSGTIGTPPPAALAMMAARGAPRPLPPPRQPSQSQLAQQPQVQYAQQPQPYAGPQSRSVSPAANGLPYSPVPSPSIPPVVARGPSPAPSRAVSPAPPGVVPPARSASPLPPNVMPPASPASAPRATSPAPLTTAPAPMPPTTAAPPATVTQTAPAPSPSITRVPTTITTRALPTPHAPAPALPRSVETLVERSDTVSSIKSLDRHDFSPSAKRALPRPPIGVSPSRSLDRGSPSPMGMGGRPTRRASPIAEVESPEQLARRMAQASIGGVVPPSKVPPTSRRSPVSPSPAAVPTQVPTPAVPSISVGVPSISLPDSPKTPTVQTPTTPTITIGDSAVAGPPRPPSIIEPGAPSINVQTTPKAPSIVEPSAPSISVTPTAPSITVSPTAPSINIQTSPTTPTINVAEAPPSPPTFAFSGLPTIAVESGDTREPGPLSIGVPATAPRSNSAAPARIEPTAAILCAGCTNPIIGRIVSAMGQRWHPQCFQCGVCGEMLEHVSAYEHDGKPYCHLDYHDRFAHRCHHCRTPIVDPRFITLDDEVLGQRFYHELHFFCSECGDPFLDPSKSSAAGAAVHDGDGEGEGETNDFVIHKGHPYCERCHLRLHKPKCRACKNPIPDVAVSAMGAKWHPGCFVCANCTHPFANNLFFPKGDKAFCTECFESMN